MSTIEPTLSRSIRGDLASSAATPSVILYRATMQGAGGVSLNVSPTIYREWVSLSRATTASNENVQVYIGWPIEDFTLSDGAEVLYFERGAIVLRPDGRCFTVYGNIYLHWRELYDLKTGVGLNIGYPITEEQSVTGGRRSRFDSADIYWNANRNVAFEVHGAIRDQWYALGGYGGFLGYPLTDESSIMRGTTEIGRYNQFEGGTIYWSAATGAFEVHGAIRDLYVDTYGGPLGGLGFPISNETPSPTGMRRYNDFQAGCVVWHADNGALDVYTNLQVFVANINGSGSHTFFESIGASSVWLYANCNVTTTTGLNSNFHLPPGGGDYGNPSASPGNVFTIAPVRGEMTVMLTMDGWDHCVSTSDQHLGTLRLTFNVDNDFGVNQPRHLDDGDFHGDIDMRRATIDNPNDPNFRRAEFWSFYNFTTQTLSRAQYAETFADVEANESDWHVFDEYYYNNFFKDIADGGNCYGMCLESAYAEHNDSLFSEPIYSVGIGAASYEINIKQAFQLGAASIDWYAANFLALQFWDPMQVYRSAKAAWDARDYPFICITDAARSAGHCVRPCPSPSMPYPFVDTGSQCIISVANPNAPGTDGTDAASRIVIDKAANRYSIAIANGDETWTGGHFTDGIISWVPFSVLCSEPRTPFWEALALLIGGMMLLLGKGANTRQITDNNGHVLYKPDRVGKSNRWDDLALDDTAIPGLVRVPGFDSFLSRGPSLAGTPAGSIANVAKFLTQETGPEVYRLVGLASPFGKAPTQLEFIPLGDPAVAAKASVAGAVSAVSAVIDGSLNTTSDALGHPNTANVINPAFNSSHLGAILNAPALNIPFPPTSLSHEVVGSGAYSWAANTLLGGATISLTSNDSTLFGIERIGAIDQTISLNAPSGATRTATISLRTKMPAAANETVYTLQNVTVPSGATFKANVLPDGKTLQVQNLGADVNVQLQVKSGASATAVKTLQIPAGKTATLAPQDINALPSSPVQVNIMGNPGGTVENSLMI